MVVPGRSPSDCVLGTLAAGCGFEHHGTVDLLLVGHRSWFWACHRLLSGHGSAGSSNLDFARRRCWPTSKGCSDLRSNGVGRCIVDQIRDRVGDGAGSGAWTLARVELEARAEGPMVEMLARQTLMECI
ncbi:hypothetical protein ACLOJK_037561 [Asimina triloba]